MRCPLCGNPMLDRSATCPVCGFVEKQGSPSCSSTERSEGSQVRDGECSHTADREVSDDPPVAESFVRPGLGMGYPDLLFDETTDNGESEVTATSSPEYTSPCDATSSPRLHIDETPSELPGPVVPPGVKSPDPGYLPPGDASIFLNPVSAEPRGQSTLAPGTNNRSAPETVSAGKSRSIIAAILIAVLLVLLGGGVGIYVLLGSEETEAESVAKRYLEAFGQHDWDTMVSLTHEDYQPDTIQLDTVKQFYSAIPFEIDDIKLESIRDDGNRATVEVKDMTISLCAGDESQEVKLSELYSEAGIEFHECIDLAKSADGYWYVTSQFPEVPRTTVDIPVAPPATGGC